MGQFEDRVEAGRRLGRRLAHLRGEDVVVLGLPRGGVPVAHEVAEVLDAPLDVLVVRKLGVPYQPELAMGAIGEGGFRYVNRRLLARAGVSDVELRDVEAHERQVLEARLARFRRGRDPVDLTGRVALVVDDGVATGASARVACDVARHLGAARVVLAVPVAPREALAELGRVAEVVCLDVPRRFLAVGHHYRDFTPTTDDEVVALLDDAARRVRQARALPQVDREVDVDVDVPTDHVVLQGHLHLPEHTSGVVVFAHGSGSSRHSPRNRFVASVLQEAGLGTLLLDLLTPEEEGLRARVFDVELLAGRLAAAVRWLAGRPDTAHARIGLFGASTGTAAALRAAADATLPVRAVVSRGGRPDLAGEDLGRVTAPTLLVVGGADPVVLDLNRKARLRLAGPSRLVVVPGATHLFEEPGALAEVARLAREWYREHLLAEAVDGPGSRRPVSTP